MLQLIALIIFLISLAGLSFILFRKIPALATLPKNGGTGLRELHLVAKIEDKVGDFYTAFRKQIFLHKILSWVKSMTLKLEVKIDSVLHKIRRKAQEIDNATSKKRNKILPK